MDVEKGQDICAVFVAPPRMTVNFFCRMLLLYSPSGSRHLHRKKKTTGASKKITGWRAGTMHAMAKKQAYSFCVFCLFKKKNVEEVLLKKVGYH